MNFFVKFRISLDKVSLCGYTIGVISVISHLQDERRTAV